MTPVRLKPAAPQSRVKHSTTEPLCSNNKQLVKINKSFSMKLEIIFYSLILSCVLGSQKNRLIEMVLLSTKTNVLVEK